ncbi:MAG: hypothetical protein WC623_22560 [Pedobacter sp.]|uniref:hypothetical protein n=1 Tax=Pedobacter sp. TaxID=1411316 RepID=UPI003568CA1F
MKIIIVIKETSSIKQLNELETMIVKSGIVETITFRNNDELKNDENKPYNEMTKKEKGEFDDEFPYSDWNNGFQIEKSHWWNPLSW